MNKIWYSVLIFLMCSPVYAGSIYVTLDYSYDQQDSGFFTDPWKVVLAKVKLKIDNSGEAYNSRWNADRAEHGGLQEEYDFEWVDVARGASVEFSIYDETWSDFDDGVSRTLVEQQSFVTRPARSSLVTLSTDDRDTSLRTWLDADLASEPDQWKLSFIGIYWEEPRYDSFGKDVNGVSWVSSRGPFQFDEGIFEYRYERVGSVFGFENPEGQLFYWYDENASLSVSAVPLPAAFLPFLASLLPIGFGVVARSRRKNALGVD